MDTKLTPLENRYNQMRKYLQIALVGIIVCCAVVGFSLVKLSQTEAQAVKNAQQQAAIAVNSDICKTFPSEPLCLVATEVKDNPSQPVSPEAAQGAQGPRGEDGRGVESFVTTSAGRLVVTFSDGSTQDLGRVQGAKGDPGEPGAKGETGDTGPAGQAGQAGAAGRSITATSIVDGSLVVTYSDGISEIIGNVIGPQGSAGTVGPAGPAGEKGADGKNGTEGTNGTNGTDGVGISSISVAPSGEVTVNYTNNTSAVVGQITDTTTIAQFVCTNNLLTLTLSTGSTQSTGVQCLSDAPAPAPLPDPEAPLPTPETLPEGTQ